MSSDFAARVDKFAREAPERGHQVCLKIAFELFRQVINATPVDTGRLRGNWQTAINSKAVGTVESVDTARDGSTVQAAKIVFGAEQGATLWLSNNLPYVQRIEFEGWSSQAPQGMVRLSMQRTADHVQRMAAQSRGEPIL